MKTPPELFAGNHTAVTVCERDVEPAQEVLVVGILDALYRFLTR